MSGNLLTCTNIHMYRCTHVPMFTCTNVHMYRCIHVQMYTCTDVHMYRPLHVQTMTCTDHDMYRPLHVQTITCTVYIVCALLVFPQIVMNTLEKKYTYLKVCTSIISLYSLQHMCTVYSSANLEAYCIVLCCREDG